MQQFVDFYHEKNESTIQPKHHLFYHLSKNIQAPIH